MKQLVNAIQQATKREMTVKVNMRVGHIKVNGGSGEVKFFPAPGAS